MKSKFEGEKDETVREEHLKKRKTIDQEKLRKVQEF